MIATSSRRTCSSPTSRGADFGLALSEQLADEPVDHRADLYALGVTLYEMFVGTLVREPDARFSTAGEVATALDRASAGRRWWFSIRPSL